MLTTETQGFEFRDSVLRLQDAMMEMEEARIFKPAVIFPDTATNKIIL